ncbi:MAG TPA: C10 family peptidase [Lentimicrobium sp.]|nr:C10 family peptidase [Lentimicrobium sp.]
MKFGKLLSLFIAVLLSVNSFAALVQSDVATSVARNFIYEQYVHNGLSISLDEVQPQLFKVSEINGQPAYYVFNISTGGWVIVSADDAMVPIIGFSPEGSFPAQPGQNLASFLKTYADEIDFARSNDVKANIETLQQWESYSTMANTRMLLDGDRDVEPLVDIMWNQDFPYNAYCPEDAAGPGGHVYAGCVATAMSMIMYYYRYPEVGTGSYSYNCAGYGTQTANFGQTHYGWNAMQNSITASMGQSVNAVAELQYHCGVSVRMQYGADGSGAFSNDVPAAIKSYFGYSSTAQFIQKMSYTASAWEGILVELLNASRPAYYSGQSSDGGHAFVCDGYQQTGTGKLFHFNFGWSGSENGYYTLTDVNGFSSQQGMVRNFFPNPSNYPYYCDSHTVTVPIGSIEDASGPINDYLSNSACTWLIAPTDSVTSITINFTDFDLAAGDSIKVYNGADENAPLLAAYGTNSALSALTSTGSRMLVKLITDGSEEAAGFRAEFNSTYPTFCTNSTTNLTEQTGTFSDGSGPYNYNNSTVCKWKINPGPWVVDLTLAFTSFDLEDGKDYLKVFAVPTNELLATLTGNQIPDPIVSPTGQFMLMFSSNGYNNGGGFEAEYYIANVNTSNEDITKNLSIYPNPATSYTEVKFNVAEPSTIRLSLHNLLGEEIYSEPAELVSGFVSKRLQLGSLSKGVYVLKISGDKGSVARKIIVN